MFFYEQQIVSVYEHGAKKAHPYFGAPCYAEFAGGTVSIELN